MGDERLHEILDLCLECKACKSECPLSVDMASLKSEFLSHYQDIHGVPLRSRLFGAIRPLNRLGAADRAALEPARPHAGRPRAARAHAGDRRASARCRASPASTSCAGTAGARRAGWPAPRGDVIFLADSFTTYTEPAIGRAAIELLEAAGYRVRLESAGCCGRSSISKGLLDQARGMAEAMVERLAPEAERGVPIVGCEPSCLLTLREEHLQLLPGRPARAGRRASRRGSSRSCSSRRSTTARSRSTRTSPVSGRPIVFHGHCHQKALAGTAATVALLERIPGAEVTELDAGCCGMAGSFGFEAEHYDAVDADRRITTVPGAAGGRRRGAGRRDRGVVPPADRHTGSGGGPGIPWSWCGRRWPREANREEQGMSNELISIIVLVAVFLVATTTGINMGVLGIVAAFVVGTAMGVSEDDIFAGFPGDLFVILVGVTYLFAIASGNGTVDWLIHARGASRRRPHGGDPVGDVPRHRDPDRVRRGRAGRRRDRRADRRSASRSSTASTRC